MIAAATPSANIQTCCYPVGAKATNGNIAGFFSLTIRVILHKFNNQSACLLGKETGNSTCCLRYLKYQTLAAITTMARPATMPMSPADTVGGSPVCVRVSGNKAKKAILVASRVETEVQKNHATYSGWAAKSAKSVSKSFQSQCRARIEQFESRHCCPDRALRSMCTCKSKTS
jgi:hypothetical protein